MTEPAIRLYSRDWDMILCETISYDVAYQFLRDSGKSDINAMVDYGDRWTSRWSGKLVLNEDGSISAVHATEFLKYMTWPELAFGTERVR